MYLFNAILLCRGIGKHWKISVSTIVFSHPCTVKVAGNESTKLPALGASRSSSPVGQENRPECFNEGTFLQVGGERRGLGYNFKKEKNLPV